MAASDICEAERGAVAVTAAARALFRQVAERRRATNATAGAKSAPAVGNAEDVTSPATPPTDGETEVARTEGRDAQGFGWLPMAVTRLRRDGARPLRFLGAPLLERTAQGTRSGMRFTLALHLVDDGRVAAAVSMVPTTGIEAGAVHRAELLDAPDALRALLERFEPERALPDPALAGTEHAERIDGSRRAIRADYEALIASLHRVAPEDDRRDGQ